MNPFNFTSVFIFRGLLRIRDIGIACIVLLAGLLGCSDVTSNAQTKKSVGKTPDKIPVMVGTVTAKSVPVRIEAIGNVEPFATVSVKSRVEGQLLKVAFHEGDAVTLGQLLFEIDSRPFKAQLRQAKANLARDRAQLENAKATLLRYEGLQGKNFVSGEMLLRGRTDVEVYAANIEADEAMVETAQLQLDFATIRSPIKGITGRLMVHAGNQVKADSVLVVINQIEPVSVGFAIPEQQLQALKEFAKTGEVKVHAKIDGGDNSRAVGKLSFIDNAVDATTGMIKLKATFDNKDQYLWAGEFVRVSVDLKDETGVKVVPVKATITGPKGTYVFVVQPDMTAAKRDIAVERVQGDESVIASGLEAGEKVVIDGQSRLVDGASVEFKPAP